MAAPSVCPVKLWCWYALQLGLVVLSRVVGAWNKLRSALSPSPRPCRLPSYLALAIDSQDASNYLFAVASLLRQLARVGLRHVSLYDKDGAMKSSILKLSEACVDSFINIAFYSHNTVASTEEFGVEQRTGVQSLMVEVLSLHDGRDVLVQAAKHLCLKSLESASQRSTTLEEEDIDASLREIGGAGPDPDLLLVFSSQKCLLGFPPWRLRLTEILHMGSIQNVTEKSLLKALSDYSKKQQRYGK